MFKIETFYNVRTTSVPIKLGIRSQSCPERLWMIQHKSENAVKLIFLTSRYVEPAAVGATSFFEVSWEFEEIAGTGVGATVPKAVTSNSKDISNT